MTARLEASVKTATAKEAEAAAAAKAEQAALQAAECAKQQSCAAVAAATGAQPHLSCPGFQPLPQFQHPSQLPEQQVRQEFEGQKLLKSMAAGTLPLSRHRHSLVPDSASRIAIGPSRDCSPMTYAWRMRDMQDHINALTRSLSHNRRVSPKRQRGQKGRKHSSEDEHQADEHKKRRPSQSPVQQASMHLDLFDSEVEETDSSRGHSCGDDDASTSDRFAPAHYQHVHHCSATAQCNLIQAVNAFPDHLDDQQSCPCQHVITACLNTPKDQSLLATNTVSKLPQSTTC